MNSMNTGNSQLFVIVIMSIFNIEDKFYYFTPYKHFLHRRIKGVLIKMIMKVH
jgi:hypothetical protein